MSSNQWLEPERIELLSKTYALIAKSRQSVRHIEKKLEEAEAEIARLKKLLAGKEHSSRDGT